jgi:hypothetical protein
LDRRRLIELADAAMEEARELGDDGDPPEWSTPEGTLAWVRAQRQGGSDPWSSVSDES